MAADIGVLVGRVLVERFLAVDRPVRVVTRSGGAAGSSAVEGMRRRSVDPCLGDASADVDSGRTGQPQQARTEGDALLVGVPISGRLLKVR